jgi:thioredoxin reductase (NADPH)
MDVKIYPVCVIGGGSAGTMAVQRTILNNDECLFFPGSPKNKKKSRALWVRKVENMPSHFQYTRGIEEPNAEVIKWLSESAFKNNLHVMKNTGVVSITKNSEGLFVIVDSKEQTHLARYVILCTGVMDVQPEIQGSIETIFDYANAQTVDYCLICDGHHVLDKNVAVIGHTNSTAWVSVMLYERYNSLSFTILTNGKKSEFKQDTIPLLNLYGIKVLESPIKEISGDQKGKILKSFVLEDGSEVPADVGFVSMGMIVYNELARELGAECDERGFVKADSLGLTSVSNLYVAGDLKANLKKQIYTAWDSAVDASNAINQKIRATKRATLMGNNP